MIKWPDQLIEDIARKRSVLVLGSGVSANSTNSAGQKPKTWAAFLEFALQQHTIKSTEKKVIAKLIRNGDYLTACELIRKSMGREDFNKMLKSEFLTPKFNSSTIHENLYKLDSRIVLTPNFDKIYDTYATTISSGATLIKAYTDSDVADCVRGHEPLVIKLHGSVDTPDHLIFSRKDYAEARNKHATFYRLIDALAITYTFVFIGCGVNDPDIRLLLEDYAFSFPLNRAHYMITSKQGTHESIRRVLEETLGIKMLTYDSKNGHKELHDSIGDLLVKVDLQRTQLASTFGW